MTPLAASKETGSFSEHWTVRTAKQEKMIVILLLLPLLLLLIVVVLLYYYYYSHFCFILHL